jgi:hypothetical protein
MTPLGGASCEQGYYTHPHRHKYGAYDCAPVPKAGMIFLRAEEWLLNDEVACCAWQPGRAFRSFA